jgi:hypothetical protein
MTPNQRVKLSKLQLAKRNSKWVTQKPTASEEAAKITQQRRDLWDALNQYVTERAGAITSVKYANPVRLEIPLDSPLADKLRELGYDPVYLSDETRIGGVAAPDPDAVRWRQGVKTSGYGFRQVRVFELRLPK